MTAADLSSSVARAHPVVLMESASSGEIGGGIVVAGGASRLEFS